MIFCFLSSDSMISKYKGNRKLLPQETGGEAQFSAKKQNELRWSYFQNTDPDMMFRMFTKENGVF